MNRLFLLLLAAGTVSVVSLKHCKKRVIASSFTRSNVEAKAAGNTTLIRLRKQAAGLKAFALKNNYNTRYCFMADMSITSGSNRFFVFDFVKDTVLLAGLVAHGYGNSSGSNVSFSNVPGSNCSSPGKYRIANAYHGKFGLAYKLHGLDNTNSNAFNRFVVLHAHECVPDAEVSPGYICMSQGCPTVSPLFLQSLKKYIDGADKPLLLWMYK